jgi:peptidoglycan hydrolase-like amidase
MRIKLNLKKSSNIEFHKSETVELDLEEYIAGCVAQEVGNAHIEACKAQAIAARTNC